MAKPFRAVELDVSGVIAFPHDPQVTVELGSGAEFRPRSWSFALDAAGGTTVEYSFDGATVHGFLRAGVLTPRTRELRETSCWFRTAALAAVVLVEVDSGDNNERNG